MVPVGNGSIMRSLILLVVLIAQPATAGEMRTYQDPMGRNTGRSVSDGHGNVTFYDAMGRQTSRAVTQGNTTTVYDPSGRQIGRVRK